MTRDEVLAWLERTGTRRTVEGMARYGLPSDRAFGVTVAAMRAQAKRIGKDHALAAALWKSGWYEARMMASLVDDPALVTARQMESWAVRDKAAPDRQFVALLPLIEVGARDDRNLVKKGVNWALRAIGKRSPATNKAAVAVARRLAASTDAAPRWVGKDALRELAGPAVQARLARRGRG